MKLEYHRMNADQILFSRYFGFYLGDKLVSYSVAIELGNVLKNKFNYAATLQRSVISTAIN